MNMKRLGVGLAIGALLATGGSVFYAAPGDTRLADAVMQSDRDAVRTLLQQKADVNAAQVDGMTALHWAARQNDLETAQTLLKAGAKVTTAPRGPRSSLAMLACLQSNLTSTIFSKFPVSSGSAPNRSIISAAKASIAGRSSSSPKRR